MSALLPDLRPIILGYASRYIDNLAPEDLELSLWGGDVVLKNLELRLDVLDAELHAALGLDAATHPAFRINSGCIREMIIHVPWTALTSRPVEVTINTIELGISSAAGDGNAQNDTREHVHKAKHRKRKKNPEAAALPVVPRYLESIFSKIVHNMQVRVNNLVLQYERRGAVLSLNVQSIELAAANEIWEAEYVEVSAPHFLLHRIIRISEATVCLDERNDTTGELLCQAPLIDRCSIVCRLRLTYNASIALVPVISLVHVGTKSLRLSFSPSQMGMLTELGLSLYSFMTQSDRSESFSRSSSTNSLSVLEEIAGSSDEQQSSSASSLLSSLWDSFVGEDNTDSVNGMHQPDHISPHIGVVSFALFVESIEIMLMQPDTRSDEGPGAMSTDAHSVAARLFLGGTAIEVLQPRGLELDVSFGVQGLHGALADVSKNSVRVMPDAPLLSVGSTTVNLGALLSGSLFATEMQLDIGTASASYDPANPFVHNSASVSAEPGIFQNIRSAAMEHVDLSNHSSLVVSELGKGIVDGLAAIGAIRQNDMSKGGGDDMAVNLDANSANQDGIENRFGAALTLGYKSTEGINIICSDVEIWIDPAGLRICSEFGKLCVHNIALGQKAAAQQQGATDSMYVRPLKVRCKSVQLHVHGNSHRPLGSRNSGISSQSELAQFVTHGISVVRSGALHSCSDIAAEHECTLGELQDPEARSQLFSNVTVSIHDAQVLLEYAHHETRLSPIIDATKMIMNYSIEVGSNNDYPCWLFSWKLPALSMGVTPLDLRQIALLMHIFVFDMSESMKVEFTPDLARLEHSHQPRLEIDIRRSVGHHLDGPKWLASSVRVIDVIGTVVDDRATRTDIFGTLAQAASKDGNVADPIIEFFWQYNRCSPGKDTQICVVQTATLVSFCAESLLKWLARSGQLLGEIGDMYTQQLPSPASDVTAEGVPPSEAGYFECSLQCSLLQIDIAPMYLILPSTRHADSADKLGTYIDLVYSDRETANWKCVSPNSTLDIVLQFPRVEVRPNIQAPYFGKRKALPVRSRDPIDSTFPWSIRLLGTRTTVCGAHICRTVLSVPEVHIAITKAVAQKGELSSLNAHVDAHTLKIRLETEHTQAILKAATMTSIIWETSKFSVGTIATPRHTQAKRSLERQCTNTCIQLTMPCLEFIIEGIPRLQVQKEVENEPAVHIQDKFIFRIDEISAIYRHSGVACTYECRVGEIAAYRWYRICQPRAAWMRSKRGDPMVRIRCITNVSSSGEESTHTHPNGCLNILYTRTNVHDTVNTDLEVDVAPVFGVIWWPSVQALLDLANVDTPADSLYYPVTPSAPRSYFPQLNCHVGHIRLIFPVSEGFDEVSMKSTCSSGQDDILVWQCNKFHITPRAIDMSSDMDCATQSEFDAESHASFSLRDLPLELQLTCIAEDVTFFSASLQAILRSNSPARVRGESDKSYIDNNPALRWNVEATRHSVSESKLRTIVSPVTLKMCIHPSDSSCLVEHNVWISVLGEMSCFMNSAQCELIIDIIEANFRQGSSYNVKSPPQQVSSFDYSFNVVLREFSLILYNDLVDSAVALSQIVIQKPYFYRTSNAQNCKVTSKVSVDSVLVRAIRPGNSMPLEKLLRYPGLLQADTQNPLELTPEKVFMQKENVDRKPVLSIEMYHHKENAEQQIKVLFSAPLIVRLRNSFLERLQNYMAGPFTKLSTQRGKRHCAEKAIDDFTFSCDFHAHLQHLALHYYLASKDAESSISHCISVEETELHLPNFHNQNTKISFSCNSLQAFCTVSPRIRLIYVLPFSTNVTIQIINSHKNAAHSQISIKAETPIVFEAGPLQMMHLKALLDDLSRYIVTKDTHVVKENRLKSVPTITSTTALEITPKSNSSLLHTVKPGFILFGSEPNSEEKPHLLMTWKYVSMHSVVSLQVMPFPVYTDDSHITADVQAWDPLGMKFVTVSSIMWSLTESRIFKLDSKRTSCTWRLSVHKYPTEFQAESIGGCVNILAEMKPESDPFLQLDFRVDKSEIQIVDQHYDDNGLYITRWNLMKVTLSTIRASLSISHDSSLDARLQGNFGCALLDPMDLTLQNFMERSDFSIFVAKHTVQTETFKIPSIDVQVKWSLLKVALTPANLCMINAGYSSWNAVLQTNMMKGIGNKNVESEQPLSATRNFCAYQVENATQCSVRAKQYKTDEIVILSSMKMTAYSWRTHRDRGPHRLCLSGPDNSDGWSEPIDLEAEGTTRLRINRGKMIVCVLVTVLPSRGLQKIIQIRGTLNVQSKIDTPFTMTISNDTVTRDLSLDQIMLDSNNLSTSYIVPDLLLRAMKIKLQCCQDEEAVGTISVNLQPEGLAKSVQIISFPGIDMQFCCGVQRGDHGLVSVNLMPLMMIRNSLTVDIEVLVGEKICNAHMHTLEPNEHVGITSARNSMTSMWIRQSATNSTVDHGAISDSEWSDEVTLWKNSFDIINDIDKGHLFKPSFDCINSPSLQSSYVYRNVNGMEYAMDITSVLHVENKSSSDIILRIQDRSTEYEISQGCHKNVALVQPYSEVSSFVLKISLRTRATSAATIQMLHWPIPHDEEQNSNTHCEYLTFDLQFSRGRSIRLICCATFRGHSLVLRVLDWLMISNMTMTTLIAFNTFSPLDAPGMILSPRDSTPVNDVALDSDANETLEVRLIVAPERNKHSEWHRSRVIDLSRVGHRTPVTIPNYFGDSVSYTITSTKQKTGVTIVNIFENSTPRRVVKNQSTKWIIEFSFEGIAYRVQPQSLAHLCTHRDAEGSDLFEAGAKSARLRLSLRNNSVSLGTITVLRLWETLGTRQVLLEGGISAWLRVTRHRCTDTLEIFEMEPCLLGSQLSDGDGGHFGLRVSISDATLSLISVPCDRMKKKTNCLSIRTHNLQGCVLRSHGSDPRYSDRGDLFHCEFQIGTLKIIDPQVQTTAEFGTLFGNDSTPGDTTPFLRVVCAFFVPEDKSSATTDVICVRQVNINMSPAFARVDIEALARIGDSLGAFSFALSSAQEQSNSPKVAKSLFLETLNISSLRIRTSVRASVRVFLRADDAAISLGSISASQVLCCPPARVFEMIGFRYRSEAALQAAWLVGSLSILGNPLGLLRSVGTGVRDLLVKPMEGLAQQTPTAFLGGLNEGASSFLGHVSAGVANSIGGFADSVVRNIPFSPHTGTSNQRHNASNTPIAKDESLCVHFSTSRYEAKLLPAHEQILFTLQGAAIVSSDHKRNCTLLLTSTSIFELSDDKVVQCFSLREVDALFCDRDIGGNGVLTIALQVTDKGVQQPNTSPRRSTSLGFLPSLLASTRMFHYHAPASDRVAFVNVYNSLKRMECDLQKTTRILGHRRIPSWNPQFHK